MNKTIQAELTAFVQKAAYASLKGMGEQVRLIPWFAIKSRL